MTLIISWIAVDHKKDGKEISSIYIASDSRYSWGNSGKFDNGIKVFGSAKFPEIFGFCGDVLFPSIVLGQLIPQIDNGILIDETDTCKRKNEKIYSFISSSLELYPKNFLGNTFTILHATRVKKDFKLYKTTFSKNEGLMNKEIGLPKISTKVFSGGSGSVEFDQNWLKWNNKKHNDFRTSRAVYHCLDQTLKTIKDKETGGLPQIVGLYRINNAQLFGIIENGIRYVYGKESSEDINSEKLNGVTQILKE
ncbi:MAG: hypothetical protein VYB38_07540 [Bacteroidota bacterium]|nr:hypothetical protein [Bacteroidota bacterium]